MTRAGHTLSILRREHGKWVPARDANMLAPVPPQAGGAPPPPDRHPRRGPSAPARDQRSIALARAAAAPRHRPAMRCRACKRAWWERGWRDARGADARPAREREVVHGLPEGLAGTEDVRLGQRGKAAPTLGEQIAAEQGSRVRLVKETALPRVGQMRRVKPGHAAGAQGKGLAVGQRPGWAVGQVADGDHGGHLPAQGQGVQGRREPLVRGSTLIGLDVRETDPPEPLDRQHGGDRVPDLGEEAPRPRVEEQRLLVDDGYWLKVNPPGTPPGSLGC